MSPNRDEPSLLEAVFTVLKRRRLIILLCLLLVPGAALAFSLTREKQYTASASLLFRDSQLGQTLFGSSYLAPSSDPTRAAATNLTLVSLDVVGDRTAQRLGGGLSPDDVDRQVTVSAEGQSDVVKVVAVDPSPAFAAKLANTFAEQYIDFRREADRASIREAQDLVRKQLAELPPGADRRAADLRRREEQLAILAALQTGNAELVQPADVPSSPSAPKPVRNTVAGLLLGLLLGILLALLAERIDRRIRDTEEIERIFDRPIVGLVPQSRALGVGDADPLALPAEEAEAFRMLRANLRYFNVNDELRSLLVVSAAPGDGKSTIALNLAATIAESGARALLIEADLRRPQLAQRLKLGPVAGLSSVLTGQVELEDAVRRLPVERGGGGAGARELEVLVAGPVPPNPTELLESDRMAALIRSAEAEYDLVVVDTPPTTIVSDAIPLVTRVGSVLVITRLAHTSRDAAANLHRQMDHLGARTLGVVVNGAAR
ncbi:MAG TPA: polysaccharide biosynthesis tyrosine autokinase, partial [Solirubrobacteraceae bacterium]